MVKPRFSIRTFLIAAVLLGFFGIPAARQQFLKWRNHDEVIPVANTDAQSVATVLREVYADQLASQSPSTANPLSITADSTSNVVIVSGPKDVIQEMRNLVSALDTSSAATTQVISGARIRYDRKLINESLYRILDNPSSEPPAAKGKQAE